MSWVDLQVFHCILQGFNSKAPSFGRKFQGCVCLSLRCWSQKWESPSHGEAMGIPTSEHVMKRFPQLQDASFEELRNFPDGFGGVETEGYLRNHNCIGLSIC